MSKEKDDDLNDDNWFNLLSIALHNCHQNLIFRNWFVPANSAIPHIVKIYIVLHLEEREGTILSRWNWIKTLIGKALILLYLVKDLKVNLGFIFGKVDMLEFERREISLFIVFLINCNHFWLCIHFCSLSCERQPCKKSQSY